MIILTRRRIRAIRFVLVSIFVIILLDLFLSYQSSYPKLNPIHQAQDLTDIRSVYIASTQWNSGKLLQEHWVPTLLRVVKTLKAANVSVFVSIYENGSWDSTKVILQQLRQTLKELDVQHEIITDDTSHEHYISAAPNDSASGWLQTAYGREMRRIPYLASIRNEALKPLPKLSKSGVKFDKILYINDVVFSVGLCS